MKALVQEAYGPLQNLRLADVEPPRPGPDGVLIRVRAAGIDPGVWHMMTGRPLMARLMGIGFLAPRVPVAGWDASGTVESVGPRVTRFGPGDEVFGNCGSQGTGSFAELACLPEDRCAPRPANLSLEEAAVLAVSGCTALQAVRDVGRAVPGSSVLVLGASGGVGHLAVQIAKASGASVTGVCSTSKVDLVRSLGADDVIDYTRTAIGGDGRTWDLVVDTAGRRPLSEVRRLLSPGGVLAIVGGEGGNALTGGFLERMAGAALLSLLSDRKLAFVDAKVTAADLLELKALVEAGRLRPHVERRYRLENAVDGLLELEKGHARGKSVVVL